MPKHRPKAKKAHGKNRGLLFPKLGESLKTSVVNPSTPTQALSTVA